MNNGLYKTETQEIILPGVGQEFLILGQRYIVTYVNPGKKRFSSEPILEKKNNEENLEV